MEPITRSNNAAVTHWKMPPQPASAGQTTHGTSIDTSSPEALLSNLAFLQRMADAFEEQGNYAECVRSAESALLLRQANAVTVATALLRLQQQQQQQKLKDKQNRKKGAAAVPAAAAPHRATDTLSSDGIKAHTKGLVAITEKGDVLLPLEMCQQAQDVVQRCNSYAVEALRHDQFDSAAFFLNRAMFLTDGEEGDNLDLRDLRSELSSSADATTAAPSSTTSDRWWWRRLLQQQQPAPPQQPQRHEQPQPSHAGHKPKLHARRPNDTEDTVEGSANDILDLSSSMGSEANRSATAAGAAESAAVNAAAALRACFGSNPHEQQLRLTLRAATLNHLGCLEQRRGRLSAAVVFFRIAIRTATQLAETGTTITTTTNENSRDDLYAEHDGKANLASTYLNLCTVLNTMGRHAEAVQACERVVPLLQQALQETVVDPAPASAVAAAPTTPHADNDNGGIDGGDGGANVEGRDANSSASQEGEAARLATMLVVAYYNLGVSLERRDAERTSSPQQHQQRSHNKSSGAHSSGGPRDGPQQAFQQAVQVSHAYHLVPSSCRSVESVMQALRRPAVPKHPSSNNNNNTNNHSVADSGAQNAGRSSAEERTRQQHASDGPAAKESNDAVLSNAVEPPLRPPSQNLSTHPPTHALPRIAAISSGGQSASAAQRCPRPPPPPHTPSPPPSASQTRRVLSPSESNSHTAAPLASNNYYSTPNALSANNNSSNLYSAPATLSAPSYRRPSRGDTHLHSLTNANASSSKNNNNNDSSSNAGASSARPGSVSSTYPASGVPPSFSPSGPQQQQKQPQQAPAMSFTAANAWSSPFTAAVPPPSPPPAVLAPLPQHIRTAAAAASKPPPQLPPFSASAAGSAAGNFLARTPPPPVPPAALFAHGGGGVGAPGEMKFAATAPPGLMRPTPPRLGLTSANAARDGHEATAASSFAGSTAAGVARGSGNPLGRRTFGSTLPQSLHSHRGSVASANDKLSRTASARHRNGGESNAGVSARSARSFRTRVAGGAMTGNAGNNAPPASSIGGDSGRSKQQQQQQQSQGGGQQRGKRQKSIDRRQQREAAASDAVLAERMYQQLVSEKEKTEVERCRRAAVQIQRVWRGVLARTWVSTLITAAVCLQRAVRRFLVKARAEHARVAAEQARLRAEESAKQEAACRVLQGRFRQFLRRLQIRREYRANQARLFYAARTIQRGYRAFCAQRAAQLAAQAEAHRREDAQRSFREKVAARRIQHAYLNYKTKRAELDAYQVRQRRLRSVVRIQAVVRGYLTRAWYAYYRVYRREQEVRSAAMQAKLIIVQSACRAISSAYYGQQRALQALLHMREVQRHRAATQIQCLWRCHVACIRRARLQAEHDRDVRHATRIQRWYRMRVQRRAFVAWRTAQQRMRAATRLQRWVRACWQAAKAREFAAYHADLLRQQQLQRLQAQSVIVIQACAHACVSARLVASVRDTFERNDALARRWQRVARGFAARREMALERRAAYHVALRDREEARRAAAARVLQRAWRGAAAKDRVESMRRAVAAANVVARAYRVYRARVQLAQLRAARQLAREEAAARRIQQAVRGFLYGRRAKEMDAYYRAEHHKKMRRLRRVEAAVMIQSQWRGYVTRKAVGEERVAWQALSSAAATIQRAWRARLARQRLRQTLADRIVERNQDSRAALKLQCFWRKVQAARRVAQLRHETRRRTAAAAVLQSWWRMQLAKREFARVRQQRREEAALEVYYAMQWEKHASLINAFLRQRESQGVAIYQLKQQLISLLTEEGRRRFLSRHEAATKIQAVFRGHYERYYARGLRAQAREEQRRAAELLARQERAAKTIQCAYRCAKAREALAVLRQAEFDRVQASHADYLESADPSEVVRELFWLNSTYQQREAALRRKKEAARRREAAARIQRLFRRHRARNVVAAAHDAHERERAARLLQDYWRHHRDVRRIKEHQRRQAAATLLQSHIRGWIVRRGWPMYRAAIEAERQERVLVQDVLDHAAIVLQCFWRRVEAQRTAARLRRVRQDEHDARAQQEAAMVIQEAFRSYQRRKQMGFA